MGLRITTTLLSSALFLLSPSGYSLADTTHSKAPLQPAQASVKSQMKSQDLRALSAAIKALIDDASQPFSGSVILLEDGKAQLALQKGEGIDQNSSFVVASLSKQITATLVLRAVDAGKLDLTRSLNSYLFADETNDGAKQNAVEQHRYDERITLHHLLSHTSGVDALGKANRFAPGSQFQYSNHGYALLGQLLEKVNKQAFAEQVAQFAKDTQLNALYAQTGSIEHIRRNLTTLAVGFDEADTLIAANIDIDESLLPGGGLIASAPTFASFAHKLHSGELLSPKSYELMTRAHTKMDFFWPNMNYGYGLRLNSDDDLREYSHTGYLPGYMSMSLHYPEFNLDLVMLENISLNLNDMERVFDLHNQIRQAVRAHLLHKKS
ncbi:serine hydrolase domain-containing protein [Pseudoalteromonas sp. T1lg10]|uniref:serine hydrolase domain-containing protein n=1 Tax=Pseudoalteromonas sp. T1lg10 TaxID=2077093 RepID=UPI000CF6A7D0|nr:serine hydrolase domain-containing protein [Pseudoalteromonas sp. T1lg10]